MGLVFGSFFLDVAALLAIISACIYYFLTMHFDFWKARNLPYIKPEVFFGNMKETMLGKKSQTELFNDFYLNFKKLGYSCGGTFQLRNPVLLICSNELAKDVLVKNFPHFHDRNLPYDEDFDPLSASLLFLEGQKWKFIRSKLNPVFSSSKLKLLYGSLRRVGEKLLQVLNEKEENGEMVELMKILKMYAIDIISDVAFGLEVNAMREDSEFCRAGQRVFEPTPKERWLQIIRNSIPWMYKTFKLKNFPDDVTNFFINVVKDTMAYRQKNNIERNDFLHYLMKIKEIKGANLNEMEEMKDVANYNASIDENSIKFTDGVLAAQAYLFFVAGYETSAAAMSACLFTLASRPDIQIKILEEVNEAIKKYSDITYEALLELKYVEQVVEETMRMYPPVGLLLRKCTQTYLIPNTDVIIPEGCHVFVPIYSFHYDPEYFPEPEKFRPERFSPENRMQIPQYAFIPFGHGPRVCIGSRLAMMEMKMTVALIVKNFEILECDNTKPFKYNPRSFFLEPADGFWVKFAKRKNE